MRQPTPSDAGNGVRVLLMDKNKPFLRTATNLLQRENGLVVLDDVGEGEEALSLTQRLQPQVVLVGLDTPGQMGLKTILRLRRMMPELTIIALSMVSGEACRRAALAAGADEFVPKRSLNNDLLPAIQRAMRRSQGAWEPGVRRPVMREG
jgi:DNA-binding NarL/FixJ family response regulator